MENTPDNPIKLRLLAISAAFGVGISLMALKFYVYRSTGSAAVLSDALESIINVVASAFALISILMSAQPPDEDHPYGHGKIEFFSAGFEGALIMLAAAGIFFTGLPRIFSPEPIPHLGGGLIILLATSAVNLALGLFLVRMGRRTASLVLVADGRHVLTDVYTSGGVVAGLFLVYLTGWLWMDGIVACLVGINILVIGARLVRLAFTGLMDASDPDLLAEVSDLLAKNRQPQWIDIHRLRATRAGSWINVDFHMILPRDLTLEEAHDEVKKLEAVIMAHFKRDTHVLIHMDPCEKPDCPVCALYECRIRSQEHDDDMTWSLNSMQRFDDHRYREEKSE